MFKIVETYTPLNDTSYVQIYEFIDKYEAEEFYDFCIRESRYYDEEDSVQIVLLKNKEMLKEYNNR